LAAVRLLAQWSPPWQAGSLGLVVARSLGLLALEVRHTRSAEQVPHFQPKGE
jgi:hypothetical protein